jgi:hypothetical protein
MVRFAFPATMIALVEACTKIVCARGLIVIADETTCV